MNRPQQACRQEVQLTPDGYLRFSDELARNYFPRDQLLPRYLDGQLELLPIRLEGGGGLLIKRRNAQGDRSVLIREVLPDSVEGTFEATWCEDRGALQVHLPSAAPVESKVSSRG